MNGTERTLKGWFRCSRLSRQLFDAYLARASVFLSSFSSVTFALIELFMCHPVVVASSSVMPTFWEWGSSSLCPYLSSTLPPPPLPPNLARMHLVCILQLIVLSLLLPSYWILLLSNRECVFGGIYYTLFYYLYFAILYWKTILEHKYW